MAIDSDAGLADEDGGVSTGGSCRGATECVAFEGSGLDIATIHPSLGQCE
jgi:hypothetical protein